MIRFVLVAAAALAIGLSACSAPQVAQTQADAAKGQAAVDAVCADVSKVGNPDANAACGVAVVGAAVGNALANDPAVVSTVTK